MGFGLLEAGRIIPAYAGSTIYPIIGIVFIVDHPRVCGEHPLFAEKPRLIQGSSPRMRGALDMTVPIYANAGIIPAYAGSTIHVVKDRVI